jgi:hypothetical protein
MILRDAVPGDTPAVLELSRLPMPGKISLIWGLHSLSPPPECGNLHTVVVERDGKVAAAAMRWDWPNGDRYLGGLRLGPELRGRLPRPLWTRGYEAGLEGVEHAWTSIGAENLPARRLLVDSSGSRTHRSGLPCYTPRQEIRSWFVPLSGRHRRKRADAAESLLTGLCPDDHRYAAVAAGGGLLYGLARLTYSLGLPGLPPPGKRIRIAHADMPPEQFASARRNVNGLDGLIITTPKDCALAEQWRSILPRYAVAWDSTLYSVHWDPEAALPPVPAWKGYWL